MNTNIKEIYLIAIVNTEEFEQQLILSIEGVVIGSKEARMKAEELATIILKCQDERIKFIKECADGRKLSEDEEYNLWAFGAATLGFTRQEFRYSVTDSKGICIKKFDDNGYNTCACQELGFEFRHAIAFEL